MKALFFRDYGGPEALELGDRPVPEIGPDDLLVDVHAASVNPIDWKMRQGLVRQYFEATLPRTLGRDMSGVVVETGANVDGFSAGDAVFGVGNPLENGTHAERMKIGADMVAAKPESISHEAAAALGVSGATVVAAFEKALQVKAGQKILIHAAAGGVGILAVQYAASVGAIALGTASARNEDWVKSHGAREVIDYRTTRFEEAVTDCDIVFDTVGGEIYQRSFQALKPGGTLLYINAAPIPDTAPPRDDVEVVNAFVKTNGERMKRVAELADAGVFSAPIEEQFPFDHWREAYALSETGHARGKIVLQMK